MGLYFVVCGRHAERACLRQDGSLGDGGPTPPFVLPVGFGKEWLRRAGATDPRPASDRLVDPSRWAALLDAFERRHQGCALYFWGEGHDEQPIRLARQEAGWATTKGLAVEEEFDLGLDEPPANNETRGTPAPGRFNMAREMGRRPMKEPDPIQWTRSKKPRAPRVVNRR